MQAPCSLSDELRLRLNLEEPRPLLEYVAQRLGLDSGKATLEVVFADGHLIKAYLHRGPVGAQGLTDLGRID